MWDRQHEDCNEDIRDYWKTSQHLKSPSQSAEWCEQTLRGCSLSSPHSRGNWSDWQTCLCRTQTSARPGLSAHRAELLTHNCLDFSTDITRACKFIYSSSSLCCKSPTHSNTGLKYLAGLWCSWAMVTLHLALQWCPHYTTLANSPVTSPLGCSQTHLCLHLNPVWRLMYVAVHVVML